MPNKPARQLRKQRQRRQSSASCKSSSTDPSATAPSRSCSDGSQTAGLQWTEEDDEVLAAARTRGLSWIAICPFFPDKSANACRKRHERLMERRAMNDWSKERLEDFAIAYYECREQMWSILAERLALKWDVVETKAMENGLKTLKNLSRAGHRRHNNVAEDELTSPELQASEPNDSGYDMDDTLPRLDSPPSAPAEIRAAPPQAVTMEACAQDRMPLLPLYVPPPQILTSTGGPGYHERRRGSFLHGYRRVSVPEDLCRIDALLSRDD